MLLLYQTKQPFLELINKGTARSRRVRHTSRKILMLYIGNHQIKQHVLIVDMIIREIDARPKVKSAIIAMDRIILRGYAPQRRTQEAENNLFVGAMQDR